MNFENVGEQSDKIQLRASMSSTGYATRAAVLQAFYNTYLSSMLSDPDICRKIIKQGKITMTAVNSADLYEFKIHRVVQNTGNSGSIIANYFGGLGQTGSSLYIIGYDMVLSNNSTLTYWHLQNGSTVQVTDAGASAPWWDTLELWY